MPDPTAPPLASEQRASSLVQGLEWIYDRVAGQVPGLGAATPSEGSGGEGSESDIDRWIAIACTTAGTTGFVTNLGGALTLPFAIPTNLVGVAAIQLRLVASIATSRGYDAQSVEVRAMALACLCGNAAIDLLKGVGIKVGERMAAGLVNRIAGATLTQINKAVGFKLLTKAGQSGVVNLTKIVPVVGGLVGGTVDALSTRAVGAVAKTIFVRRDPAPAPATPDPVVSDIRPIAAPA